MEWPVPPTGPPSPEDPDPPEGCWNCGSRAHFARECPRAIPGEYCYRCGTRGYTVRTCPYCRPGWLVQGPYVRGRGATRGLIRSEDEEPGVAPARDPTESQAVDDPGISPLSLHFFLICNIFLFLLSSVDFVA